MFVCLAICVHSVCTLVILMHEAIQPTFVVQDKCTI